MDNDNKIIEEQDAKNLHEEVMLFLGDEVNKIHQKISNNSYDIEQEYAKTKKNHSPYNFLVLFGAFLVVIATVFFINKYISVKDEEITVSLDEFEDLNLNNLLDTVAAAQLNYDNALKNKLMLETELETSLNDLKSAYENELFVLDSLSLSDEKEYNKRKEELDKIYKERTDEVNKEFESELILAGKQVTAYKEQLDEFDSVKVANAQEKEKLLNSERQLKQMEIEKLTNSYEGRISNLNKAMDDMRKQHNEEMRTSVQNVASKYKAEIATLDPQLSDSTANNIITSTLKVADFNGPNLLVRENIDDAIMTESMNNYQKMYNDYKYLDDVVKSIPQKYSIPKYVATSRNLVNKMSSEYAETAIKNYQQIQELNNIINDLNTQLDIQQNEYEEKLANTQAACENSISNIFTSLQVEAILLNVAGYENIQVAINPEVQKLIPAEGISGKIILSPKAFINGKIFRNEVGGYYFEVEKDDEGNYVPVDFSQLNSGMTIEILW